MIERSMIDGAFAFYAIDGKYRKSIDECVETINRSRTFTDAVKRVFETLYCSDFRMVNALWRVRDKQELFTEGIPELTTNVMILLGWETHRDNILKCALDEEQIAIHKDVVKGCFERDIAERGYPASRISQMIWAAHFSRMQIIEIGRLQYQYAVTKEGKEIVKIHIPGGEKLDPVAVADSLEKARDAVEKTFHVKGCPVVCHTWLLSKQIRDYLKPGSNICRFQDLFEVRDGDDCTKDILDFLFHADGCTDYGSLPEDTSLRKNIKEALLQGKPFYKGMGVLKPTPPRR